MIIRLAGEEDAEAIARVHVDSWRSSYKGIIAADYLASLSLDRRAERWREVLEKQDAKNCTFVAENKDEQIVGFASGGPQRDSTINYEAELYAIYLLESAQRQELGGGLLKAIAGHLFRSGFKDMLVLVLEENPSRKFYEAQGGQYVTEKPITIGDQELIEVAYGWSDLKPLSES